MFVTVKVLPTLMVFAGVSDAQLTEKGAEQAKITGQHLKNEKIVTICCSPFIRARQTAEIIAAEIGIPVYEIVTIDELQERCFLYFVRFCVR